MRSRPALALLAFALASCGPDEVRRDWTLVYLLPYDNDLASHADPILDALEAGVRDRVAILALVDRPGPGGVERIAMTERGRVTSRVAFEASAHPAVLGRLLDRAVAELPAERYALFVLDHGGRLDELGLDLHPAGGPESMSARGAATELAAWRGRHGRRLDLLVLQQCGRGSVETQHLFRDEADVIVTSQGLLQAPNGYYGGMLAAIARGDAGDGAALARALIDAEPPLMFAEYTAVRGAALSALPAHLDRAIDPLLAAQLDPRTREAASDAIAFRWMDEAHADLLLLLRALYRTQSLAMAPIDALERFMTEELVVHRRASPAAPNAARFSGLSVLVPSAPGVLDRYDKVPLYRVSRLAELARRYPQVLGPEHVVDLPGTTIHARPALARGAP